MVGDIVSQKAISLDNLTVIFKRRREIIAPVAGRISIKLLKSSSVGVVWILRSVMPFPNRGGPISGGLKMIGNGGFIEVQSFSTHADISDTDPAMISACQKLGSCGRADRAHIKSFKAGTISGDGIEVRRI